MLPMALDFQDVLIVPKFSDLTSRSQVNLETTIQGVHGASITGIPIIAANMSGVGTFSMLTELSKYKLFTAITKDKKFNNWVDYYNKLTDTNQDETISRAFVTIGMSEHELNELARIYNYSNIFRKNMNICIDVANGYMNKFYDFISRVRDQYPNAFIIAGTVCTPDAAERIVKSGADLARIGIGGGSACRTREVAGVGYPQFSAIQECSQVANIVSDGGCSVPGDFAKAFGAGASMVMAGSIFAGHDEGEVLPDRDGKITFFGMSSSRAHPPLDKEHDIDYRASEGRVVSIPARGPVKATVQNILGGLRSACTYTNSASLNQLYENASFVQVKHQLNTSLINKTIGT